MPFESLSDYFIFKLYESIREQASTHARFGEDLLADTAKQRAEELHQEIERRGLFCVPIEWPIAD